MLILDRRLAAMLMGAALLTTASTAAVSAQDPSGSPACPRPAACSRRRGIRGAWRDGHRHAGR